MIAEIDNINVYKRFLRPACLFKNKTKNFILDENVQCVNVKTINIQK